MDVQILIVELDGDLVRQLVRELTGVTIGVPARRIQKPNDAGDQGQQNDYDWQRAFAANVEAFVSFHVRR